MKRAEPITEAEAARARLDELGQRKAAHDAEGKALAVEIRAALEASEGLVPLSEAADRLGIHRTTLYRVYRPQS